MSRVRALALPLIATSLVLAACGGDDDETTTTTAAAVTTEAAISARSPSDRAREGASMSPRNLSR